MQILADLPFPNKSNFIMSLTANYIMSLTANYIMSLTANYIMNKYKNEIRQEPLGHLDCS